MSEASTRGDSSYSLLLSTPRPQKDTTDFAKRLNVTSISTLTATSHDAFAWGHLLQHFFHLGQKQQALIRRCSRFRQAFCYHRVEADQGCYFHGPLSFTGLQPGCSRTASRCSSAASRCSSAAYRALWLPLVALVPQILGFNRYPSPLALSARKRSKDPEKSKNDIERGPHLDIGIRHGSDPGQTGPTKRGATTQGRSSGAGQGHSQNVPWPPLPIRRAWSRHCSGD